MKSLLASLLFVVLGVALLTVTATALVSERVTRDRLEDTIAEDLQAEREIAEQLNTFAFFEGSWEHVDELIDILAFEYDERIALTDRTGVLIADSADPDTALPDREVAFIDPGGSAVSIGIPDEFLFDLNGFDIQECLDSEDFDVCVSDIEGANGGDFEVDDIQGLQALLFIGSADGSSSTILTDGLDSRLILVVSGVLLLAALATWLAVRHVVSPVDDLVQAATAFGSGELSRRVPERGADEMVRLSSSFNEMATSIESQSERRRQFTSDVAHELRTPLANVRGFLEAAQDGISPIDRALVDSLHEDALHLQSLVDDLQVLTLAEAGELRMNPVETDIRDLLQTVAAAHQPAASEQRIRLAVEPGPRLNAYVDPNRARQIIINLVSNALRHTDADGSVQLAASEAADRVLISITDDGEGIAAEHVGRIFERFYRVDTSRNRATGGSGVGLAITKELVEASGGSITVESVIGQGSVFTVSLPRTR